MANYYFLAASLPSLVLGEKPDLTFEELSFRLELNLSKKDFEKVVVLRRLIDLNNIKALFLEDAIDPKGNLTEKELDEALLLKIQLPLYVFDFLDQFEHVTEKVKAFSGLVSTYFLEEIACQKGFLKKYLEFEKNWRLILMALRAKQLKRDVLIELQFEDFSDPIVHGILAQKDSNSYDPPAEYMDLKEKYLSIGMDPWQQHKIIAQWRFDRIGELVDKPFFSIDWILAYIAQFLIVEQWNEMDEEKGKIILEAFVG